MQNKKVTMLAAVLAVTIIAMAGVGYALTYTATTTNTGNTMGNTYIKLTQDEAAAYDGEFLTKLYFDTENTAEDATTYKPVYTHIATTTEGQQFTIGAEKTDNNVALVSNKLGLNIIPTNTGEQSVTLDVTVTNFHPENKGLKYTMVLSSNYTDDKTAFKADKIAYFTDGKWSFTGIDLNDATVSYTVLLFVSANGVPNGETGFAALDAVGDAQNKFTFTVTANTGA
ncbi:adhesin-like protein [methanogenic archaeon ISO4-H5]|nr:adhesin-like protein [methanogenic archaeon ISO4-H5]